MDIAHTKYADNACSFLYMLTTIKIEITIKIDRKTHGICVPNEWWGWNEIGMDVAINTKFIMRLMDVWLYGA